MIDLVYEGLSGPRRAASKEWLQQVYHDRNNLPLLKGDVDGEDDIMKAISRSNTIGAKPKNLLELMAQRIKSLYTKNGDSSPSY